MMLKQSSVGVLILFLVAFALLLNCLPGNTALADGAGGQWPLDPPSDSTSGGDEVSGNVVLFTIVTTLQLVL